METGGTLDWLTLRLVLTVSQPAGHTHTRPPFKKILIQEIKCIRHGVKKIQEGAANEEKDSLKLFLLKTSNWRKKRTRG